MNLNINQIEAILPQVNTLYKLAEKYNQFNNIGYINNETQLIQVVLQNMQAQGKDCFNYNESKFVETFNKGFEFLTELAKYKDWYYVNLIKEELEMMVMCVLHAE